MPRHAAVRVSKQVPQAAGHIEASAETRKRVDRRTCLQGICSQVSLFEFFSGYRFGGPELDTGKATSILQGRSTSMA